MTRVDRIDREVQVPAVIERVWEALTSAEELPQWFGDIAELDLRVGGTAKFGWTEYGGTFDAVIETVDSPSRFAFRWAVLPDTKIDESPSTLVEFTLEALEEGTKVRVLETGFASLPEEFYQRQLEENTSGWNAELQDLVEYLSADRGV